MYLKMILAMGFFLISFAANIICDVLQEVDKPPPRYIEFEDDSGIIHLIDTNQTSVPQTSVYRQDLVKFLLYTRQNTISPQALSIGDRDALKASYFNPNDSTAVIVHGWMSTAEKGPNPSVREAYFSLPLDVNIISFDWSEYANDTNYAASVSTIVDVGRTLARFLEFLNSETGVSFNDIHLIGHSLGGHVVGNCGRSLQGAKVARVTGLDPAGPLFTGNPYRLRESDGHYVEAIHTNGGGLGSLEQFGDADFYANGGIQQPGCANFSCSHSRSYELFAESVKCNDLIARKCSGITSMLLDNCNGEATPMGNSDLRKSESGVYRVNTRSTSPYSL